MSWFLELSPKSTQEFLRKSCVFPLSFPLYLVVPGHPLIFWTNIMPNFHLPQKSKEQVKRNHTVVYLNMSLCYLPVLSYSLRWYIFKFFLLPGLLFTSILIWQTSTYSSSFSLNASALTFLIPFSKPKSVSVIISRSWTFPSDHM